MERKDLENLAEGDVVEVSTLKSFKVRLYYFVSLDDRYERIRLSEFRTEDGNYYKNRFVKIGNIKSIKKLVL